MTDYLQFYKGCRTLVTGGLGFIGSNLARRLAELGADVLLVDFIPAYGGNLFNIAGIEARVRVNIADVRQDSTMSYLVRDRDVLFNLAGQVSHIDSMRDPHTDLEINCRSQLTMLEACRKHNRRIKSFAGTRQVRPAGKLPVDETQLVRPTDINGINKAAAILPPVQQRLRRARLLSRLTNVYGPRQLVRHNRQGFIGWFIRLASRAARSRSSATALRSATSSTWTTCPTRSCARERSTPATATQFNVGGSEPISHRDLTAMLIEVLARGRCDSWTGRRTRRSSTSGASTPTRRSFRARPGGSRP